LQSLADFLPNVPVHCIEATESGLELAGWIVMVSPNSAEHAPDYAETPFETREEANDFAEREKARLEAERYLA
jgi:hypothetical protein